MIRLIAALFFWAILMAIDKPTDFSATGIQNYVQGLPGYEKPPDTGGAPWSQSEAFAKQIPDLFKDAPTFYDESGQVDNRPTASDLAFSAAGYQRGDAVRQFQNKDVSTFDWAQGQGYPASTVGNYIGFHGNPTRPGALSQGVPKNSSGGWITDFIQSKAENPLTYLGPLAGAVGGFGGFGGGEGVIPDDWGGGWDAFGGGTAADVSGVVDPSWGVNPSAFSPTNTANLLDATKLEGFGEPGFSAPTSINSPTFRSDISNLIPSSQPGSANSGPGGAGNTPLDGGVSILNPDPNSPALAQLSPQQAAQFGVSAPAGGGTSPIASTGPGLGNLDEFSNEIDEFGRESLQPGGGTAADLLKKASGGALDWAKNNPLTVAKLGIAGYNAFAKPQLTDSQKQLQQSSTGNSAAASAMIQAGGATGAQWQQQKSSIDASINQQVEQAKQQILQQAQNSGQGADSLVTLQQIQKMTQQAETQRQQLYQQAQGQNVQQALQLLGISDAALQNVANAEFNSSKEAKQAAAQTAELALRMNQTQKPTANAAA